MACIVPVNVFVDMRSRLVWPRCLSCLKFTLGETLIHFTTYQREWCYPEVVHGDSEGVHDLSINGVILQVDQVHLLTDLRGGGEQC